MSQPARSKENFVTKPKSSIEMAFERSHSPHSPCRNPPHIDPVEDELARDPGLVGGLHLGSISPAPSRNPTLGPDLVPALIPAPVLAPTPALVANDELFKKFMKVYLETNQGPRQPPTEREQIFKTKVAEVYYGKSLSLLSIVHR